MKDTLYKAILEIINQPQLQCSTQQITLVEDNEPSYPPTKIRTQGQFFTLKFGGENRNWFPIFNEKTPYVRKTADYHLFSLKEEALYIYMIELKSKNISDAYIKLAAHQKHIEFIVEMARFYAFARRMPINNLPCEIKSIIVTTQTKVTNKFGTNARKLPKYNRHPKYAIEYIPHKAGTTIYL